MAITFRVLVDWDRDQAYSGDITSDVIGAAFSDGIQSYPGEFASPAQAIIQLNNRDGKWSPLNPASALYGKNFIGTLVKIVGTYSGTDYVQFIGLIRTLTTTANDLMAVTEMVVTDSMDRLLDVTYQPPLQTNVTTGAAIQEMFDRAVDIYPYRADYAIADYAIADSCIVYSADHVNIEAGETTLAYAGDVDGGTTGIAAQQFLRLMTSAEMGGRFFYDARVGQYVFQNRSHDNRNVPDSFSTLEGVIETPPPNYVYGDDLVNAVDVNYQPRMVGTPASVVYEMENLPRRISAGERYSFSARYKDPNNDQAQVGVQDGVPLVKYVDYVIDDDGTGSGDDMIPLMDVVVSYLAREAQVTVNNNDPARDAYITTFQLRATPLLQLPNEVAHSFDAASAQLYNKSYRSLSNPALTDGGNAQLMADYYVLRRSTPTGRIDRTLIHSGYSATASVQALSYSVGTPVTVSSSKAGIDERYVVIGRACQILLEQDELLAGFVLAPAGRMLYAIADDPVFDVVGECRAGL